MTFRFDNQDRAMKKQLITIRQGDVFLTQVSKIPATAAACTIQGDIILAYGEATGHAHRLTPEHVRPFGRAGVWDAAAERFIQVIAKSAPAIMGVVEEFDADTYRIATPVARNGFVRVLRSNVQMIDGGVQPNAPYALLQHEEHDAIALPNGVYRHSAPQREYTPEAIRAVAD